jgi:hypothetical protein
MKIKEYITKKSSDRAKKVIMKIIISQKTKHGKMTLNQDFVWISAHQKGVSKIGTLIFQIKFHSG